MADASRDESGVSIRAVLDASALIGPHRHELILAAHQSYYTLIWSAFIIAEVVRVRTELAIKRGQQRLVYRTRVNAAIRELSSLAEFVDYTLLEGGDYQRWLKDPDDEPVLATALVGQAQLVVSANTKDFPPSGTYAGIRYVTPRQFLDELYALHPQTIPVDDE